MRICFLWVFIFLFSIKIAAQTDTIFVTPEKQAEYSGGNAAMFHFLAKNLKMLEDTTGICATYYLSFVVDTFGKLTHIECKHRCCSPEILAEMQRVCALMPPWKPAEHSGKKVKMHYILPIHIRYD